MQESKKEASGKQIEVSALYVVTLPSLQNKILESHEMMIWEGEYLAGEYLAAHLDQYDGDLDEESFIEWSLSLPEIKRRMFFCQLRRDHRDSVRSGIWSVVGECLDLRDHSDPAFIIEQLENDAWAWVWERIDKFLTPGTASMPTRLFAAARFQARTWRQDRLRHNERFDDADIEGFGMDATGKTFFDPGGHPNDPEGTDTVAFL